MLKNLRFNGKYIFMQTAAMMGMFVLLAFLQSGSSKEHLAGYLVGMSLSCGAILPFALSIQNVTGYFKIPLEFGQVRKKMFWGAQISNLVFSVGVYLYVNLMFLVANMISPQSVATGMHIQLVFFTGILSFSQVGFFIAILWWRFSYRSLFAIIPLSIILFVVFILEIGLTVAQLHFISISNTALNLINIAIILVFGALTKLFLRRVVL